MQVERAERYARQMRGWIIALAALMLVGCSTTRPTAAEVFDDSSTERAAAITNISASLDRLAPLGELLGEMIRNQCETGQHNWKIDTDWDVRCDVTVTRAIHVEKPTFEEAADHVHGHIACDSADSETEAIMRDYWEAYKGKPTRAFKGPYIPDYLPRYRLGCVTDDGGLTVNAWSTLPVTDKEARAQVEYAMGSPCAGGQEGVCSFEGPTAEEVWTAAADREGWIVYISETREYVVR